MSGKCDVCGKHTVFGHNVSFSKRRTNRRFKPNVQSRRVTIGGETVKLNMCVRCIRTMAKTA